MVKRFIITGGAGFIGSAIVRHLIAETPHQVAVADKLTYAGNLKALESVAASDRYRFFRVDVADARQVYQVIEKTAPDVIMHLAAETHVDRSIEAAPPFVHTNILGTMTLLDAARAYWRQAPSDVKGRFRLHHVSTDEVFGALGADGKFDEWSPHRPNSPYAASKAASDHLVRAWHATYGMPAVISHSSNNFGPFQFPEKLVPFMILKALEGRALPVYGRGENVRDWLYVDDHVRALLLVAEQGRIGQTYLIGASSERTNLQIVTALCECIDRLAPNKAIGDRRRLIRFVADRPGHDYRYAIDATKIRSELGWRPLESFETGLEKTVRWYLANRDWWGALRTGTVGSERRRGAITSVSRSQGYTVES